MSSGRIRRCVVLFALTGYCSGGLATSIVYAQPGRHKEALSWDRNIRGLFSRHCIECHNKDEASGNVDLASDENPRHILRSRMKWQKVVEVLDSGQMPPKDERQPSQEEREQMVAFLHETFGSIDCDSIGPGPATLRKLNRTEYDNAIEDLLGIDLKLSDNFSPDAMSFGFDNVSGSLSLDPAEVEMYHSAASKAVAFVLDSIDESPGCYQRVFGSRVPADLNVNGDSKDREYSKRVVRRLASVAFRRPVDESFVNRMMRIYDLARESGESRDAAIGSCLSAILISPRFLFRIENNHDDAGEIAYPVDSYELASRLSYFLWSRAPDEELLELAKNDQLDQATVREQVKRMLLHGSSSALVENFFFQWLDLRRIDSHTPDADVFPRFDDSLRASMKAEVEAVFRDIVQGRTGLSAIVDTDRLYVDRVLANHYGLEIVASEDVQLHISDDRRRGGLLTSAALLMLQSDPGRTNIPRRGNFLLSQLLGTPPPPPPPNVPDLKIVDNDEKRSLREIFELHRSSPECKNCHEKIDPMGFALENYDALGRWRESDRGVPIDASGQMPDGTPIDGAVQLKDYLLKNERKIFTSVARNLLIYAVGRALEPSDDCVVNSMVDAAIAAEGRFEAMIQEVVRSVPFTHRQNPQ